MSNLQHIICIDKEDLELLKFNLQAKFHYVQFDIALAEIDIDSSEQGVLNKIKFNIQYYSNDILSFSQLEIINNTYKEWLTYIRRYLKYKYIIKNFKNDDIEYYTNTYQWEFKLITANNIGIYKNVIDDKDFELN